MGVPHGSVHDHWSRQLRDTSQVGKKVLSNYFGTKLVEVCLEQVATARKKNN